jgi:hypothetical protein
MRHGCRNRGGSWRRCRRWGRSGRRRGSWGRGGSRSGRWHRSWCRSWCGRRCRSWSRRWGRSGCRRRNGSQLRLDSGRHHRDGYRKADCQRMPELLPQPCAVCLRRPRCVAHECHSRNNASVTNNKIVSMSLAICAEFRRSVNRSCPVGDREWRRLWFPGHRSFP